MDAELQRELGAADQGGVHGNTLPHRHTPCNEVSIGGVNYFLAQLVFFTKLKEGQDRGTMNETINESQIQRFGFIVDE